MGLSGAAGYLDWTEIDTAHFLGNFPESAILHATTFDGEVPPEEAVWDEILPRTKMGPHRQHCLTLTAREKPTTHVRITIYPDGGIKRLRLIGRRSASGTPSKPPVEGSVVSNGITATAPEVPASPAEKAQLSKIPALPLTPEAFAAYGSVIQAYPNPHHVPKGIKVNPANFGSALKFNHLSPITALPVPSHPSLTQSPNFSVYHCEPTQQLGGAEKASFEVNVLERHEYSSQAFVPMGGGASRYLMIVAHPGADGQPALETLRAFVATSAQGFSYKPNVSARSVHEMSGSASECLLMTPQIWHHPMIALDATTDFACITNETGAAKLDCEILEYGKTVALVEDAGYWQNTKP